jgi:hypothetical protein
MTLFWAFLLGILVGFKEIFKRNTDWLPNNLFVELGVTIARKVLPHPQGIKGSVHNLLNMIPLCQDEI